MEDNSDFKIRFAVKEDTAIILDFIKELAEYERMSNQVRANIEILKKKHF